MSYQNTERPTYEEQVSALGKGSLVQQELNGRYADYESLKLEFVRALPATRPYHSPRVRRGW